MNTLAGLISWFLLLLCCHKVNFIDCVNQMAIVQRRKLDFQTNPRTWSTLFSFIFCSWRINCCEKCKFEKRTLLKVVTNEPCLICLLISVRYQVGFGWLIRFVRSADYVETNARGYLVQLTDTIWWNRKINHSNMIKFENLKNELY